jgi:signal transduction histidine kinase/CheY-like chemotaxis protein
MNSNNILTDISFLYELSLSVGQSLDRKKNCEQFIHTLMSRKNLEFGAVWIRSYNIPYSDTTSGYQAIYSYPKIKLSKHFVEDSNFFENCFNDSPFFSIPINYSIANLLGLKIKDNGTITFFKLQELGFLVLFSSKNRVWSQIELRKLENVIDKFTVSIKACLFHEKSINDLITISKTQKELEQAKIKAEEANNLKSAFLSNISHEIRTPINSIIGFTTALRNCKLDKSIKTEFVNNITNSGKRLIQLIDNVIDISKIDSNQLKINHENFSINHILTDIYAQFKQNSVKKSNFEFILNIPQDTDNLSLCTDKEKFAKVFVCLLDNAFKFTKEGRVELGYMLENHEPIFYIRDTGIGISKENQQSIFDLFRQGENSVSRRFEGSGIGLTLSKKLIDLLGGNIWFDSESETGTNFYFCLSRKNKSYLKLLENSVSAQEDKKQSNIEFSKRNVLIAEDVKSNYNYLSAIIEFTDANVIWAKDGKEAIDICIDKSNKIDLVFMDLKMPKVNGIDAIKKIRTVNNVPIIVQTAFSYGDEKSQCLKAGANDFVTKPIDPQSLVVLLQKYL